jgi:hypothetical protein
VIWFIPIGKRDQKSKTSNLRFKIKQGSLTY